MRSTIIIMILVVILIRYPFHSKCQQSRRSILGRGTAQLQKTLSCPPCIQRYHRTDTRSA